mgnify:FL=1
MNGTVRGTSSDVFFLHKGGCGDRPGCGAALAAAAAAATPEGIDKRAETWYNKREKDREPIKGKSGKTGNRE